jgi:hypothetical protein
VVVCFVSQTVTSFTTVPRATTARLRKGSQISIGNTIERETSPSALYLAAQWWQCYGQ